MATTNYGIPEIDPNALVKDGPTDINAALGAIDTTFGGVSAGPRANRPTSSAGTPGIAGRRYRSTDTGQVDEDTGTGWATVIPALVSSLPTTPDDGQVVDYLADATNGVVWRLRYRAASASTYKWEVVGASALHANVDTAQASPNTSSYGDLATVGPQITVPLAGEYDIAFSVNVISTDSNFAYASPKIGSAATSDTDRVWFVGRGAPDESGTLMRTIRRTVSPAGAVVKLQYRNGISNSATYSARELSVMPIRVG